VGRSSGKRVRTIFTQEQLDRLEKEFERQQYMVGTERYDGSHLPFSPVSAGVISRGTRGNAVPTVKVFKNAKNALDCRIFHK